MKRPIKVNLFFPITYLLLTAMILILPAIVKPVETGIGIAMILTAVPVYVCLIAWKTKPAWVQQITSGSTNWLQRLLMILPQDKEE